MFNRNVQFLGSNLCKRCDSTLTKVNCADHHLDMPIAIHLHDDSSRRIGRHCRCFLKHGKAFTAHLASFPLLLALFFSLSTSPADFLDDSRQTFLGATVACCDYFTTHGLETGV